MPAKKDNEETTYTRVSNLRNEMINLALSLCEDAKQHKALNLNELDRVTAIINLHDSLIKDI